MAKNFRNEIERIVPVHMENVFKFNVIESMETIDKLKLQFDRELENDICFDILHIELLLVVSSSYF